MSKDILVRRCGKRTVRNLIYEIALSIPVVNRGQPMMRGSGTALKWIYLP
jgi:hypothetical protein